MSSVAGPPTIEDAQWTEDYLWIVVLAAFASLFASFGVGANDVANAFATSVGSKALTIRQAILLAAIFEFSGAVLLGSSVMKTIRKGIADVECFQDNPALLMHGMFCALLTTGIWLIIASNLKMPVSTTHTIVGSIVGMTMVVTSPDCVVWYEEKEDWPYVGGVAGIVLSWVIAPLLSYGFAAILFLTVRTLILRSDNSYNRAFYFYPVLVWATLFVLTLFMLYKGAKSQSWVDDLGETEKEQDAYVVLIGVCIATGLALITLPCGLPWLHYRIKREWMERTIVLSDSESPDSPSKIAGQKKKFVQLVSTVKPTSSTSDITVTCPTAIESEEKEEATTFCGTSMKRLAASYNSMVKDVNTIKDDGTQAVHDNAEKFDEKTELFFRYVQVFTVCCDSFAHGANDVANSVGPLAAVYLTYKTHSVSSKHELGDDAYWILALGGFGIVAGLSLYGYKIIQVLGCEMAKITPSRGFAIELGAVAVIIMGTRLGIPLSTTHCQVGATCGVAHAEGRRGINYRSLGVVILGWILTLVFAGCTAALLTSMGTYAPSAYGPAYDGMANPLSALYASQPSDE